MKLTDNLYFYPEGGMLDCNTYVIKDKQSVIVDPGYVQYLPSKIKAMAKDGIKPEDIKTVLNTHLHADHYWANEDFKKLSKARIASHPLHKKHYSVNVFDTARFFGFPPVEFAEDGLLEGDRLSAGTVEFEFIACPGHSLDSICYYSRKDRILVCGDVIFSQNTGRVDLPGGNASELKASINNLSELDIEYLLPGHMNIVQGADRVKKNFEFVRENVFGWL